MEASGRHTIDFNIRKINPINWNGFPVGYRVYYQSLLKINSHLDLKNLTSVESTHPMHVNFRTNSTDFSQALSLTGLEVFTNYSLIVGAYNSKGVGPLRQIFWRTNQGGMWFSAKKE